VRLRLVIFKVCTCNGWLLHSAGPLMALFCFWVGDGGRFGHATCGTTERCCGTQGSKGGGGPIVSSSVGAVLKASQNFKLSGCTKTFSGHGLMKALIYELRSIKEHVRECRCETYFLRCPILDIRVSFLFVYSHGLPFVQGCTPTVEAEVTKRSRTICTRSRLRLVDSVSVLLAPVTIP
jgi:hypothetical protein